MTSKIHPNAFPWFVHLPPIFLVLYLEPLAILKTLLSELRSRSFPEALSSSTTPPSYTTLPIQCPLRNSYSYFKAQLTCQPLHDLSPLLPLPPLNALTVAFQFLYNRTYHAMVYFKDLFVFHLHLLNGGLSTKFTQ